MTYKYNNVLASIACVLLYFVAPMLLASCTDKLDEVPDNRTEIDDYDKVRKLLTSAYPVSTPAVICELSGDNYVDDNVVVPATHNDAYEKFHEEAYQWKDINNYSINSDDTPYQVWEAYYAGIAVCNHAIDAMRELSADPKNDPDLRHSWGEAHVLRAYLHFILVNVFAESYKNDAQSSQDRGIPYVADAETVVHVDYSTSNFTHSVKDTYDLIEKDILEGIDLIEDSKYKVPAYHFNRNAANAFAARFYLFKRDYAKCIQYANEALGDSPSNTSSMLRKWGSLNPNTMDTRLNDYNDETAPCNFLIQSTYSLQDRMLSACRYAINSGTTFTQDGETYTVPSTLSILYQGGGPNWSGYLPAYSGHLFIFGGQEYGVWLFRVYEYFEYTDKIAGIGYVHMLYQPLTAEETLLCRAEAKLYSGDRDGAISDLNLWTTSKLVTSDLTLDRITNFYNRGRNNNIYVSALHPQEMGFEQTLEGDDLSVLDCILHFRRIETMFEGQRWFDIKRYGITVYHHYRGPQEDDIHTDSLTWDDPRRVLQLPNNVIEAGYPPSRQTGSQGGGGGGYVVSAFKGQPTLLQTK
ncbi:MAG: RagB/SusD family nutrient uptake outer membrane protein [Prevotella sp.]|nr:RagB/SusD family nutrient uptake outer membrane protein [Prevotella sp.]